MLAGEERAPVGKVVDDYLQHGGAVDSRPVIFYLSSTVFLLFATVKALESRSWK